MTMISHSDAVSPTPNPEPEPAAENRALVATVVVEDEVWHEAVAEVAELVASACEAVTNKLSGRAGLPGEVAVVFTDDARQQALNAQFRGKDATTNVLSFPADADPFPGAPDMPRELGDITLARETIMSEAESLDISVPDHTSHLIVHGLLHLFGYDHESSAEAEDMERLETEILSSLNVRNPHDNPLRGIE